MRPKNRPLKNGINIPQNKFLMGYKPIWEAICLIMYQRIPLKGALKA
jgi:hypothetical protein|tara:strand:+ start:481 stop:621 length:141 start_codon:yes stop_codon:yes gene_type:complete